MHVNNILYQIEVLASFTEKETLHSVLQCHRVDIMNSSITTPTGSGRDKLNEQREHHVTWL